MRLLFSYRNYTSVHRFQVNTLTGYLVEEMVNVREFSSLRTPFRSSAESSIPVITTNRRAGQQVGSALEAKLGGQSSPVRPATERVLAGAANKFRSG